MKLGSSFVPAAVLGPDDLGAMWAGIGSQGDPPARLAAVVALLAGGRSAPALGGAFAEGAGKVTIAFTSGRNKLLREAPVNEANTGSTDQIGLRKQC